MFEIVDNVPQSAVIKVFGVGGGGGNAVEHMAGDCGIDGVDFICANTDSQALNDLTSKTLLQLGTGITKGLGAGAHPEIGRKAAEEDKDRIAEVLKGADMVFITAGMGGGTGTGAAPVVAQIAKEMGILTVAVVTKPFPFEGKKRARIADAGLEELSQHVDSLITIPNEKLLQVLGEQTTLIDAFAAANDVLEGAVKGIAELIVNPGMMNVDFADIRTVMSEMGMAMMSSGEASGENRAYEAVQAALHSKLLEDINLQGAKGLLINITAGPSLSLGEFSTVGDTVEEFASDNATVVTGTVIDDTLGDTLRVTIVATGIGDTGLTLVPGVESAQRTTVDAPVYVPEAMPEFVSIEQPVSEPATAEAVSTVKYRRNESAVLESGELDMDYLDIPAFLRRQAD